MVTPYVSRDDALAFIVEERSSDIIQAASTQSVALQTFRQIPMSSSSLKMNLLETFPQAQWLTATAPADPDIVTKPTTEMSWGTKDLYAEEAACIVLIPENVIDDANINLWPEIQSRVAEAIARLIDQTVFFGTAPAGSVPATFPVGGLVGLATTANHVVTPAAADPFDEVWSDAMALVEADGYDVSDGYGPSGLRSSLRGIKDANGVPLYVPNLTTGGATQMVYGVPIHYVGNGSWDATKAQGIVGDASMAVIGMRQRLTAKRLSEATVGDINLAEQDMVGLRVKTRLGFTVVVPKGLGQSATPFPFAVIGPKAP